MRDFVTADCELTTGAIAALTGAKLRRRPGGPSDPQHRAARHRRCVRHQLSGQFKICRRTGDHSRRRLFDRAALCRAGVAQPRGIGDGAAIPGFRRGYP